jgi:hypothetical protein
VIHARSVRLAAVVVIGGAVALATTACGGTMQAGAAAVVQGHRTTDGEVQSEVTSYISLLEGNGVVQAANVTDAARVSVAKSQLELRVQQAVLQKTADDLGLTVGPDADAKVRGALVDSARQALGATFHGSDNEAVSLFFAQQQQGAMDLAPSVVPTYVHFDALRTAIVDAEVAKLKVDPNTNQGQAALQSAINPLVAKAVNEVDIRISPRYGTYDLSKLQFLTTPPSWMRPTEDQAAAQAQQQQPQ